MINYRWRALVWVWVCLAWLLWPWAAVRAHVGKPYPVLLEQPDRFRNSSRAQQTAAPANPVPTGAKILLVIAVSYFI